MRGIRLSTRGDQPLLCLPGRPRGPLGQHNEPAPVGDPHRPPHARPHRPHRVRPRPRHVGRPAPTNLCRSCPPSCGTSSTGARRRGTGRPPGAHPNHTWPACGTGHCCSSVSWPGLRRSELAALTVDQVAEHPNGLVLAVARSKTNQTGERAELAVLPRGRAASRCPRHHPRPTMSPVRINESLPCSW